MWIIGKFIKLAAHSWRFISTIS